MHANQEKYLMFAKPKNWICFLWIITLGIACTPYEEIPPLERRAQGINQSIMCPTCPGESIDQSQNPLAAQMRKIVLEKLEDGWTNEQIDDFFVERYGPSVLLEPPRQGFNIIVWIVPPLIIIVAGLVLFLVLRGMRNLSPAHNRSTIPSLNLTHRELANYFRRIENAFGNEEKDPRNPDMNHFDGDKKEVDN